MYVFCGGHMMCDQMHAIKIPSGLCLAPWDSFYQHFISLNLRIKCRAEKQQIFANLRFKSLPSNIESIV